MSHPPQYKFYAFKAQIFKIRRGCFLSFVLLVDNEETCVNERETIKVTMNRRRL